MYLQNCYKITDIETSLSATVAQIHFNMYILDILFIVSETSAVGLCTYFR